MYCKNYEKYTQWNGEYNQEYAIVVYLNSKIQVLFTSNANI